MGFVQETLFTAFLGVILTFLLAKIVSFAVSSPDSEAPVAKETTSNRVRSPKTTGKEAKFIDGAATKGVDRCEGLESSSTDDSNSVGEKIAGNETPGEKKLEEDLSENQKSSGTGEVNSEIDDDWEGIERSELEKVFAEAVNYVEYGGRGKGKTVIEDECGGCKLSGDVQTELYGLHKVAVEGSCSEPRPMAFKLSARAKWNAWNRLGTVSRDLAMEKYIRVLSDNIPDWMHHYSDAGNEIQGSLMSENTGKISEPELERKLASDKSTVSDSSDK